MIKILCMESINSNWMPTRNSVLSLLKLYKVHILDSGIFCNGYWDAQGCDTSKQYIKGISWKETIEACSMYLYAFMAVISADELLKSSLPFAQSAY